MKSSVKSSTFYTFFLLFFIIYGPNFTYSLLKLNTTLYLCGIGFFIFLLIFIRIGIDRKFQFYMILTFILLIYILFFVYFFAQFQDWMLLNYHFLFYFSFISSIGWAYIIKYYLKINEQKFLYFIFLSTFINSCILYLLYFIPPLRDLTNSFITGYEKFVDIYGRNRLICINKTAGASSSVLILMGLFSGFFIRKSIIGIKKYWCMSLLILISLLFVGRTGFFLFIVILPISYLLEYIILNDKKKLKNLIFMLVILVFVIFILISLIMANSDYMLTNKIFKRYVVTIRYIMERGLLNEPTVNKLLDKHYHLPDESNTILLFGTGSFGRNKELGFDIGSDVGYIKTIYSIGIIGSFIVYFFYFCVFIFSFINFIKNKSILLCYITTIILILFISEFKESMFGKVHHSIILFIALFVSILNTSKRKVKFIFNGNRIFNR